MIDEEKLSANRSANMKKVMDRVLNGIPLNVKTRTEILEELRQGLGRSRVELGRRCLFVKCKKCKDRMYKVKTFSTNGGKGEHRAPDWLICLNCGENYMDPEELGSEM